MTLTMIINIDSDDEQYEINENPFVNPNENIDYNFNIFDHVTDKMYEDIDIKYKKNQLLMNNKNNNIIFEINNNNINKLNSYNNTNMDININDINNDIDNLNSNTRDLSYYNVNKTIPLSSIQSEELAYQHFNINDNQINLNDNSIINSLIEDIKVDDKENERNLIMKQIKDKFGVPVNEPNDPDG